MKILLTGANGFLGWYLCRDLIAKGYEVIATGRGACRLPFTGQQGFIYEQMDFTDPFAVHDIFEKYSPGIVIHAGAMTKADDCETNQWHAYITNVESTVTLLTNANQFNSFFILLSTDFVFDGERGMYKEEDLPRPVNFYGKTKLEAEEAVKEYEHEWAIVRTALVYGSPQSGRGNLLTTVKSQLEKGEVYRAFNDQYRTPTYIEDLSKGIVCLIEKRATGLYHMSGKDLLTPYQMAVQTAEFLGLDSSLVYPAYAGDFKEEAKRPPKTGFIITKARELLNYDPVSFREGLGKTFGR